LEYENIFEERQVLYCGRGHDLFARHLDVAMTELKDHQFVRRAYASPDQLPGIKLGSTAVADLMEGVAAFILSGRYLGFLPAHLGQQWMAQDMMRPLLDSALGYPNPVYIATRKTETNKPILSVFLKELRLAHGAQPEVIAGKRRIRLPKVI
jgi:DNA-binding transcriptional LysR family regulator